MYGFEPFTFFFDPTKRLFFVYLLASLLLTLFLLWHERKDSKAFLKKIFAVKLLRHPSTRIDLQLLFFNTLLRPAIFFFVSLSSIAVAKSLGRILYQIFPSHQSLGLSYAWTVALYSIVSFVALDFSRFFQHYLFHKIPFLWQFHKIHHSAPVLTPLTLYRTHPIESLISSFRRIFVIGVVSGFFIFLTQTQINAYAILGVNAFDFAFNFFGSNLRHSHVWLSFGRLNWIFISPAQHQIHHSRAIKHRDKNLGFALSVWDQLFGSFYPIKKKEFLIFGVQGERYQSFFEVLRCRPNKKSL